MNRMVLVVLMAFSTGLWAQEEPPGTNVGEPAATQPATACPDAAGEPLPEGVEAPAVECPDSEEEAGDAGEIAAEEAEPDAVLEDFLPSEEISEDYAVPLPSDI